ncbi:endonuclease III [candidate division SR1 bacterium]|nr:endonuclease III [candidate division SR1 bacterium]
MTEKKLKKADYDLIFDYISSLFTNMDTELKRETPFQLLVAVMLSAQSTDKQVNKITDQLFLSIKGPDDVLKMGQEKLEKAISSVNYYRMKAKHIYHTAEILDGKVIPEDEVELMRLPGVGEKTAKVIQYVLYHQPVIAVDTHVHRVANRLGIVQTKTPLETSKQIEKAVPESWKMVAHHALILFGRYYCKAVKPKCEGCGLREICRYKKIYRL